MKITIELDPKEIVEYQKSLFDVSFPIAAKYNDAYSKVYDDVTKAVQDQVTIFWNTVFNGSKNDK